MDFFLVLVNLLVAIAAFVLSVVVWKSSNRLAKAEYTRSLQDAWNALNVAALASDENICAVETLYGPNSPAPQDGRKVWMTFVLLNALQATFLGWKGKLVDEAYAEKTLKDLLHPLLLNDFFFPLTQNRGYHPQFSEYCYVQRDTEIQRVGSEAMP